MSSTTHIFQPTFQAGFAALGEPFFVNVPTQGLPQPHWVTYSAACAQALGWPEEGWQTWPEALAIFSGNLHHPANSPWPGMCSGATPYSGHQFGVWAGQLGDGRAHLLGKVMTPQGPMEVQLKGAGRTPFSRSGDGRAVLRSSIREFLCSEAMHHLGVPTTRALCVTGSALQVRRERMETAAIVTRVAPSFLRFGHFEHFSHQPAFAHQPEALRRLLRYAIDHHFPHCSDADQPALAMLHEVALRAGSLLADWQALGFCHGVMNTDNMSLVGLTLDYGPFGFMDAFDPQHICNHSDTEGRYAFGRQPQMAWWNLLALAQALVPLVGQGQGGEVYSQGLGDALAGYWDAFNNRLDVLMRTKLGLVDRQEEDALLINDWLRLMAANAADYTIAMRALADTSWAASEPDAKLRAQFHDQDALAAWWQRWRGRRLMQQTDVAAIQAAQRRASPKFILRNHLAELAIRAAEEGDFTEVQRLLKVLHQPYDDQPEQAEYAAPPPAWAADLCVSCSS